MGRRFVVLSGLPGSGKSTLARRLSVALSLPVIDKDDLLESLFESKGTGDPAWRRALSRESDLLLQSEAAQSQGALLVSFWHLPGMQADSGTPTDWLLQLGGCVVNVRCMCPAAVAAERFLQRKRHAGHGDGALSYEEVRARIETTQGFGQLEIGHHVDVDTSAEPLLENVIREIEMAFSRGLQECVD
jgi:glucokinase